MLPYPDDREPNEVLTCRLQWVNAEHLAAFVGYAFVEFLPRTLDVEQEPWRHLRTSGAQVPISPPKRVVASDDNRGWSLYLAQRAQPVATGSKSHGRENRKEGKTVAVGCDQLPKSFHGKEEVDGSSPSEVFHKSPSTQRSS